MWRKKPSCPLGHDPDREIGSSRLAAQSLDYNLRHNAPFRRLGQAAKRETSTSIASNSTGGAKS